MAAEIVMPKLGATMESGAIIRWLKEVGDPVKAGDPLVEIRTDKVNMELEAETSGILGQITCRPDEEAAVFQVIGYIEEAVGQTTPAPHQAASLNRDRSAAGVRCTPAVRKLAHRHRIDLLQVEGTGPHGRITREDVEKCIEREAVGRSLARDDEAAVPPVAAEHTATAAVPPVAAEHPAAAVGLSFMRRTIARRMTQSAFTAPHVTLVNEADMSAAISMREQLLPIIERQTGYRVSYTEIMMKAVAAALDRHPTLHASLVDERIAMNAHVHIGVAVSLSDGLLVPVIRDVNRKGLTALTAECKQAAKLCREGKIRPEQLTGGTFTISNLGMYEVDAFTPIINPPESAILGMGRIAEKAVGVNGRIELRPMMTLSLSFDHRAIDGAPAAAFLTDVKRMVESPYQLLL